MKRILMVLVLALGALVFVTPAVSAHTGLESSTPKAGATLDAPPTEIVLNFDEALLEDTVKVVAHAKGDDTNVLDDVAEAAGKTVTVPWPATLPGGEYELAYRIVSADGHPVTGTLAFSYTSASSSAPATPSASASADPTPSPRESTTTTVTASPIAAPVEPTTNSSPLPVIIIGLVIGIAIGLVIFFVAKKRA